MRRALPFLLLTAIFAVVGCAPSYVHIKLADPTHLHRAVVSLSPSTSELIEGLGLGNTLKGRTAADNYPPSIRVRPVVASLKPDYEMIKGIHPDLILYDDALYNAQDVAKIKELGFPVFALSGNTVKDYITSLYQLSNLVGGQTFFGDYVDRINVAIQSAQSEKFNTPPKVAFVSPGEGGRDLVAGVNSFQADVIKICGGVPVGPPSTKFEMMNEEELVTQSPDIIFVPTSQTQAATDIQKIKSDPKLQSVAAVKKNNLIPIDADVVYRRGERVDNFITNIHRELARAEQH